MNIRKLHEYLPANLKGNVTSLKTLASKMALNTRNTVAEDGLPIAYPRNRPIISFQEGLSDRVHSLQVWTTMKMWFGRLPREKSRNEARIPWFHALSDRYSAS